MTHDEKIVEAVALVLEPKCRGFCGGSNGLSMGCAREFARAAITAFQAEAWQDISTAPKDAPILVAYDHEADPYFDEKTGRLTDYGAIAEGGSHLPGRGVAIAKWADSSWEDEGWESPNGGYWLPGGWFLHEDGEHRDVVCNPTHWQPLPNPPASP